MVAAKECTLRARVALEQLFHSDLGIDFDCRVHRTGNLRSEVKIARVTGRVSAMPRRPVAP